MLNTYQLFYRSFGIRKKDQLVSPPLHSKTAIELPVNSLLHFLPFNERPLLDERGAPLDITEVIPKTGPTLKSFLMDGKFRYIYTHHISELKSLQGEPTLKSSDYMTQIRDYQHANSDLMWLKKDPSAVFDTKSLIVECYSGISTRYRYKREMGFFIDKFHNELSTIYQNINYLQTATQRNQFLVIDLPDTLPVRIKFEDAIKFYDRQHLKLFRTNELMFLVDIWRWLSEDRSKSILATLTPEALNSLNVIFTHKDRVVMINLGLLDTWRKDSTSANPEDQRGWTPAQVQKAFLKSLLDLIHAETIVIEPSKVDGKIAALALRGLQPNTKIEVDDEPTTLPTDFDELEAELTKHEAELNDNIPELPDIDDVVLDEGPISKPTAVVPEYTPQPEDSTLALRLAIKQQSDSGSITINEAKRLQDMVTSAESLPNPFGSGLLRDLKVIKPAELAITKSTPIVDIPNVTDKKMLKSTLIDFDQRYIKEVFYKDVIGFMSHVQRAGYILTDLSVKETEDVMNHEHVYSATYTPVTGKVATLNFPIPVINEDGVMLSGGVKYYLKKQLGDMPIRKVSPSRVALTSYYSKLFIDRSPLAVNNYERWLCNQIRAIGLDRSDDRIVSFGLGKVFDHYTPLPRTYSALSKYFTNIVLKHSKGDLKLSFDYKHRYDILGGTISKTFANELNKANVVLVGTINNYPVSMGQDGTLWLHLPKDALEELGSIESILGLPTTKAPVEVAVVNIFGKVIPLGFALGYYLGLPGLVKALGVTYRVVPANKQAMLTDKEFRIRFKDESWIFDRTNRIASMVLSGYNSFSKIISLYSAQAFSNKDLYLNIMESAGLSTRYIKEFDLMFKLYIDPITKGLLEQMHEPTEFLALLLRSVELLLDDQYPDENDKRFMRIKGYERIAGAVYTELIRSIRVRENAKSLVKTKLDMKPVAIKMAILTDAAKEIVNEINPVFDLKRSEVLTYGGTGGRSTKTMVKDTRRYHDTDVGVISEATVDSGNVGIISYLSSDPNFNSLRGTSNRINFEDRDVPSMLSTSALLAPSAEKDDMKRIGFISIQGSHVISCVGSTVSPIVTGYEAVIAHRTNDLFAYTAKQDGRVIVRTDDVVTIEYKDGSKKSIELGRRFGISAGSVYPFDVISDLKEGAVIKHGTLVCYNKQFFAKDYMDPNGISMKGGVIANTMILDSTDTFEDSSAISVDFARKLGTETTYIRHITVNFDQAITHLVEVGDVIDINSILCTIQDSVTAQNNLFDDETLKSLRLLSAATPRSEHKGKVERIEIYYNGDLEEMSENLVYLARKADRALGKSLKGLGRNAVSGKVDGGYRIDGNPLLPKQLVVKVYITAFVTAGVADKAVAGNQLKTVIGRVMTGRNETEDGIPIDAIFGYMPIANRIVGSPEEQITTGALLEFGSAQVVSIYEGK